MSENETADVLEMAEAGGAKELQIEEPLLVVQPEEATQKGRTVSLIAPLSLPEGHRLEVVAQEREFEVRIPPGGVTQGHVFEAEEIICRPVTGRWFNDIIEFSSRFEGNFCPVAFFFPLAAAGVILQKLGRDCCGISGSPLVAATVGFMFVLNIVWLFGYMEGCVKIVVAWYAMFAFTITRWAARKKYTIPGSCVSDWFYGTFCACCSLLQIYRHMKVSGDEPNVPICKKKRVKATIV